MSQTLIHRYLDDLSDLRRLSGTDRETVVREAFKTLLKGWGRSHDLKFVPEYPLTTAANDRRYIDGALVDPIRIPFGYWEAKDLDDNLDKQIEYKFRRGYRQIELEASCIVLTQKDGSMIQLYLSIDPERLVICFRSRAAEIPPFLLR